MNTAIEKILELTEALNVQNIQGTVWTYQIDDQWFIAVNGQETDAEVKPCESMTATLRPYHFGVWYNGWLAGVLNPMGGGFLAAGTEANEESFCLAVQTVIANKHLTGQ